MPKKTRKEKILADERKTQPTATPLLFTYAHSTAAVSASNPNLSQSTYIKQDLLKTVLIGTLFIAFEILLAAFSGKLGW